MKDDVFDLEAAADAIDLDFEEDEHPDTVIPVDSLVELSLVVTRPPIRLPVVQQVQRSFGKQPRRTYRDVPTPNIPRYERGYSFNALAFIPENPSVSAAPPGSETVFQSFDIESMPIPKRRKVSQIIDTNHPLPELEYQTMEPYLLNSMEAPRRRAVFVVENLHYNVSKRAFH